MDSIEIENAQQHVRTPLHIVWEDDVAIPFESAIDFADQFDRYFLVRVAMRIAHVRALIDEHVIQNSAVAFLSLAEFLDEFREVLHVIAIDLRVAGDVFRLVAVMGRSMPAATRGG